MPRKIIIFLAAGAWWCLAWAHPFYLSVTDLKYNGDEKRIQGTVRIFTNDLEDAMRRLNGQSPDLLNTTDSAAALAQLDKYIQSHLQLSADYQSAKYRLLGFENEDGATWLYLETTTCGKPRHLGVTNNILCDFLPQQMNIVHFSVDGERRSARVNCPENQLEIHF